MMLLLCWIIVDQELYVVVLDHSCPVEGGSTSRSVAAEYES